MTRVSSLVILFLMISSRLSGQCTNSPTLKLNGESGNTCGVVALSVTGNTFGGSATRVTITENGSGTVSPASATTSPFTFTYTPKAADAGKKVIITFTTDNPLGLPCAAAKATFTITVNATPIAPVPGTITKPTCAVATGSVVLSGLPSAGTWILTRNPDGVTITGTGTSNTISGIPSGTYTFSVTASTGCSSQASKNVVIPAQPESPASPVQTVDCALGSGKAVIKVTSPTGTGLTYSLDGSTFQTGVTFSNVANGTHSIRVKNASGCTTTGSSFQVSCACANPPTVTLSSIIGFTCGITAVTVSGNTFGGNATSVTITENGAGNVSPASSTKKSFSFTYTPVASDANKTVTITVTTNNPLGSPCIAATATYTLNVTAIPSAPQVGTITQPTCSIATGSVVLNGLPSIGTWTLTRSPGGVITTGTGTSSTISGLDAGTFAYTVAVSGCVSPASANVVIIAQPMIPSPPAIGTITQPTCSVSTGSVQLTGLPPTSPWSITRSPGGNVYTGTGSSTIINGLNAGSYTFTITGTSGCMSAASSSAIISDQTTTPSAPVPGSVTQPTCTVSTGSVILSGLPATGSWTLIQVPGSTSISGSGTSITLTNLTEGIYTFTVTNSAGCISMSSSSIEIKQQPSIPTAPLIGLITPPSCTLPTGSVVLNGLPATGIWTLTSYPGTLITTGSGTSTTVSGLVSGDYNFTLTNANGCISYLSANVTIPAQPVAPSPPVIGAITQPVYGVPTGSVTLNGLPNSSWILTLSPGNIAIPGTGVIKTISGLAPGTYSLTVANPQGCTSESSASFVISPLPGAPVLIITNPDPVCYPATIDLRNPSITVGSSINLTYSYWTDPSASIQLNNPESVPDGTYYIKGTKTGGEFSIKPVVVQIFHPPVAFAGPDQVLNYRFETTMAAEFGNNIESGVWSVISGTGEFSDSTYSKTTVTGLSKYNNLFLWKVTNGICPYSSDTVLITVNDLMVPSLITPNMDGKNDCLIIKGSDAIGTIRLIIFDRRGSLIYKSENYDNTWNGVDQFGKPVPEDTYFYVIKPENGKNITGFVMIRR